MDNKKKKTIMIQKFVKKSRNIAAHIAFRNTIVAYKENPNNIMFSIKNTLNTQ